MSAPSPPRFPLPIFLFCWLQCALFVHPVGTIMSDAVVSTSVNVVEKGTLEVDQHAAIDLMVKDGRYYAGFGPGQWLVAVPYYAVLKPAIGLLPYAEKRWDNNRFTYKRPKLLSMKVVYLQMAMVWFFLGPLTGLFFAKFYSVLRRWCLAKDFALLGTLATASGTLVACYASMYSRQWLATLLIALVALHHLDGRDKSPRRWYALGLAAGYAVPVDYIAVLGLTVLSVFHFTRARSWRDVVPFVAGVGTIAVATALYHWWLLGNPFETPYQYRVWHEKNLAFDYKGERINFGKVSEKGIFGLGLVPSPDAVLGLTFGSFKGLFFFSPVLLYGLIGHLRALRSKATRGLAVLCLSQFVVCFWVIASSNSEIYWSSFPIFFGPRYLLYGVPFLALGIAALRFEGPFVRIGFGLALVVSVATNVLGLMFQELNLLSELDAPSVQSPIPHFVSWLVERGPRIPLLDQKALGAAPSWVQGTVFLGFLGAMLACIFYMRRRERTAAETVDATPSHP